MTGHYKKQSDSIPTAWTRSDFSWPASANQAERDRIFTYLEERFGIQADLFDNFLLYGKKDIWYLLKKSIWLEQAAGFKAVSVGLKSFRRIGEYIKPTSRFMQMFGLNAQKSRYELSDQELQRIMADEPIDVEWPIDPGYVILAHQSRIIGLGFLNQNRIQPQLPR
jgi:NOL1/NOP2/fmu family ribosome biogenesis protein